MKTAANRTENTMSSVTQESAARLADPDCKKCRGEGTLKKKHGLWQPCKCVKDYAKRVRKGDY